MKPGDLVKIYTMASTHIEKGSLGILIERYQFYQDWWVVYVVSLDKKVLFDPRQLIPVDEDHIPESSIDLTKSRWFSDGH